jgi:hypothetical protein
MNGFRAMGWIKEKSDSGKTLSEFLPFVYTRDKKDGNLDKQQKDIKIGQFLD